MTALLCCRYYCNKSCQTNDWPLHKLHQEKLTKDINRVSTVDYGEARGGNQTMDLISKAAGLKLRRLMQLFSRKLAWEACDFVVRVDRRAAYIAFSL